MFLTLIPLLMVLIIVGIGLYWGAGINRLGGNFVVLAETVPIAERRLYGLVAASVPAALFLRGLWHLFRMFMRTGKEALLVADTVTRLRAFAKYSVLAVLSAFLLSGVMRWAMGVFDNAPLWTHLGFSITHGAILFLAAVIYVATLLIEEGHGYKKEMEEYI